MPREALHLAHVESRLEQMGAERVPEDVGVGRRVEPRVASDPSEGAGGLEAV